MVVEVFGGNHGYGEDFSVADPGKAVALMTNTCHGVGNDAIGSYNERVVHGLTSSADVSNTSLQGRPYGRQLAITVSFHIACSSSRPKRGTGKMRECSIQGAECRITVYLATSEAFWQL